MAAVVINFINDVTHNGSIRYRYGSTSDIKAALLTSHTSQLVCIFSTLDYVMGIDIVYMCMYNIIVCHVAAVPQNTWHDNLAYLNLWYAVPNLMS